MIYLTELYYFFDQKNFPYEKAVLVTAQKVSEWSKYYRVKLLAPKKGIVELERSGQLPDNVSERKEFILKLLEWVWENSYTSDLFLLYLNDDEKNNSKVRKFDHHDDTCCWYMNLSNEEFRELTATLKQNDLPEDLYYPEDKAIMIPYPWKIKIFGWLIGGQKVYTPKRWQAEHRNG